MRKILMLSLLVFLALAIFGLAGCATTGKGYATTGNDYAKAPVEKQVVDKNKNRNANELCGFCGGWPF